MKPGDVVEYCGGESCRDTIDRLRSALAAWNRRASPAVAATTYHEGPECCPKCVAQKAALAERVKELESKLRKEKE